MRSLLIVSCLLAGLAAACDKVPEGHCGVISRMKSDDRAIYNGEVVVPGDRVSPFRTVGIVDCRAQRRQETFSVFLVGERRDATVRIAFSPACDRASLIGWLDRYDENGNESVSAGEIYALAVRPALKRAIEETLAQDDKEAGQHARSIPFAAAEAIRNVQPVVEIEDLAVGEFAEADVLPSAPASPSGGRDLKEYLLLALLGLGAAAGLLLLIRLPAILKALERLAADRQGRKMRRETAAATQDVVRILMTDRALAEETHKRLGEELNLPSDAYRT